MPRSTPGVTPRPHRGPERRRARTPLLLLLLAPLLALVSTACATEAKQGDCVQRGGGSYESAECSGTALRILAVHTDGITDRCTDVPGVTNTYYAGGPTLCLGPLDADPATAVNTAKVGDCLGDTAATPVRKLRCSDKGARWLVVQRKTDVPTLMSEDSCSDVPGTTSTYSWSMEDDGSSGLVAPKLSADILFCLGPAGVDPRTSADLAQRGDCLRETGSEPSVARVDCAAPQATYRVTRRIDGGFALDGGIECGGDASLKRTSGLRAYVLCLVPR